MLLEIFFGLGWVVAALAIWVAWRFAQKASMLDEIITFLNDDINTNLLYFVKIAQTPALSDIPEFKQAHQNMIIMGRRLEEILHRMEDATGLRLRPPPPPSRPRVID